MTKTSSQEKIQISQKFLSEICARFAINLVSNFSIEYNFEYLSINLTFSYPFLIIYHLDRICFIIIIIMPSI